MHAKATQSEPVAKVVGVLGVLDVVGVADVVGLVGVREPEGTVGAVDAVGVTVGGVVVLPAPPLWVLRTRYGFTHISRTRSSTTDAVLGRTLRATTA